MPIHTTSERHSQDAGNSSTDSTPTPHRPSTPRIPLPKSQDSISYLSQMSAPLFTEDRYSSSSDDCLEVCNAEIMLINR